MENGRFLPIKELKDAEGKLTVSEGDDIEVFIDKRDSEGNLVLSHEKAAKLKVWDDIKHVSEIISYNQRDRGRESEGRFICRHWHHCVSSGSQIDVRPIKDLEQFIGQTMEFQILKYDRKRNNVVLSRRSIVATERESEKRETLNNIVEGNIIEGVIKNITDYGIFIDLGRIDGLLHVTDISWGRIAKPSEIFHKGDKIKVKVLSFDREKERVSLGLKQLHDNPWEHISEKISGGALVQGQSR